jgi:hypothetical protein
VTTVGLGSAGWRGKAYGMAVLVLVIILILH